MHSDAEDYLNNKNQSSLIHQEYRSSFIFLEKTGEKLIGHHHVRQQGLRDHQLSKKVYILS